MADDLVLFGTDPIKFFLVDASDITSLGCYLPRELRDRAASLLSLGWVPYKSLMSIWYALPASFRPSLHLLFGGSEFKFTRPQPREKSEELKATLRMLTELTGWEYTELIVNNVVPKKYNTEPFSSYKDQICSGLHVVLVMFIGYLVGYAAFRFLFNNNPIMNVAGGILGSWIGVRRVA